jgi:hypothetical protein
MAAVRGRQEVVRIAADQGKRDAELLHELRRHHSEEIRSCRLPNPGCTFERMLGATRTADDGRGLQHPNLESRPCQHQRGD